LDSIDISETNYPINLDLLLTTISPNHGNINKFDFVDSKLNEKLKNLLKNVDNVLEHPDDLVYYLTHHKLNPKLPNHNEILARAETFVQEYLLNQMNDLEDINRLNLNEFSALGEMVEHTATKWTRIREIRNALSDYTTTTKLKEGLPSKAGLIDEALMENVKTAAFKKEFRLYDGNIFTIPDNGIVVKVRNQVKNIDEYELHVFECKANTASHSKRQRELYKKRFDDLPEPPPVQEISFTMNKSGNAVSIFNKLNVPEGTNTITVKLKKTDWHKVGRNVDESNNVSGFSITNF